MRKSLALVASIALALPAVASAAPGDISVRYSDLNLQSAEGQRALDRRIESAAREYCGADRKRSGTRIANNKAKVCVGEMEKQIARQVQAAAKQQPKGG